MAELILDLVSFNRDVPDYSIIIPLTIVYLLVLWVIVSVWVYFDAKKRYQNRFFAILIALANLVLQFPFLFVYLLIRPDSPELAEDWVEGGLNVPIVNFTGDEGVIMSLELRINPKKLADEKSSEMKIDVSFESEDDNKKLLPVVTETTEVSESAGETQEKKRFSISLFPGIKSKLSGIRQKLTAKRDIPVEDDNQESTVSDHEGENDHHSREEVKLHHKKKKKKKKKHRH